MSRDTDRYDFFVSYASKDNLDGRISAFIDGILAEHRAFSGGRELTKFFDKDEITHGRDWQHTLHHGIAESRVFVAFVSPDYFASEWCCREWRAWVDTEIAKHVFSDGARPVYFIPVPGFDAGDPGPLPDYARPVIEQLRRRQYVYAFDKQGREALRENDLKKVLEALAQQIDAQAERVRQAAQSANTVPPYNQKFSGRVEELLTLRERLKSDGCGVVCGIQGLGGIGKTELAFAYAHAFAGVYPGGRFLVPCDGKPDILQAALVLGDYPEIRAGIHDEERKIPEHYFKAILRCLRQRLDENGSILLVLDNVTAPGLMTAQGTDALTVLGPALHLLMTTRLAAPADGRWLTLDRLPEEDAIVLLEKHRAFADDAERESGRTIVRRLGGFAMAVELVAAWLAVHEFESYRKVAKTIGLEDLERIAADDEVSLRRHQERRLTAVLGPILDSLSEAERRTLEYASLLPPEVVALPWLESLLVGEMPGSGDSWGLICSRLLRLALLGRGKDARVVRVHRLLQDVVKKRMGAGREAECQAAVDALVRSRDAVLEKTTQWVEARWEVEPMEALANSWGDVGHPGASWLLNQVAFRWHALAEWPRAEPLMRRALEIDESSYGKDHPNVARDLNNLAQLLKATNRLSEAEPLMRRALAIDEASYGKDHPRVAIDLNNLATLLQDTNRLSEAEPLMRRALAIDEASYGKDHPNVAIRLNNLAQLLQDTNRLSEAEPLMRRALEIDEASYGKDHPDVAIDLNNLATLLQATNRLSEAEPLMRRALEIDEASYGKDHPDVAIDLNNLAQLLQDTNRLSEAEPLMRRALEIDEASYGKDHPNVAIRLNNLAQLLQATNRLSEAEPLMRRALAIDEASYGKDHPNVARDLNNLAQLLKATNRLSEAEPLMRRALAIDEASYGKDHPDVAIDLNNLATLLQATNRLSEAEPLMRRHLEIFVLFTRGTGHEHPHLRAAVGNYVALLVAMELPQAELVERLVALGPEVVAIWKEEM